MKLPIMQSSPASRIPLQQYMSCTNDEVNCYVISFTYLHQTQAFSSVVFKYL